MVSFNKGGGNRRSNSRPYFFFGTTNTTTSSSSGGLLQTFLVCFLFGVFCFYAGFFFGAAYSSHPLQQQHGTGSGGNSGISEAEIQRRIKEQVQKVVSQQQQQQQQITTADDTAHRFPNTVQDIAVGLSRVDRNEFATHFDMGVPLDETSKNNAEVILLYSHENSVPSRNPFVAKEAMSQTTIPLIPTAAEATENCDFLNVILTDHNPKRRQCLALMGQYEAFHLQKWMRLPEPNSASGGASGKKLDAAVPLRLVNRGAQASGRKSSKAPTQQDTIKYWSILSKYLQSLESVLEQLRPIAASAAAVKNNTIVVMVCNFGQSELLMNFICSARSRGIDLSAVLVFATDRETLDLAQALGVKAFYDETNFEAMPKKAAGRYADTTFTSMMLAKVYCVQMISMLGYDLLFQDVDVIWYRDPLEYFHDDSNPNQGFDAYFQDDGNHALFYAPYSANTGFYYIRNNDKTQHFFNSLLMSGDLILAARSHQIALVALLSEHASLHNLKVKIFARTENDFPGGHAFHRRKDFMKDIISGAEHPYIFHMSWTHSKDNKQKFFQQLGEWYVHNACIQETTDVIEKKDAIATFSNCCLKEATVTCHYRDKPSKTPCRDSPPIDNGRPSFW